LESGRHGKEVVKCTKVDIGRLRELTHEAVELKTAKCDVLDELERVIVDVDR